MIKKSSSGNGAIIGVIGSERHAQRELAKIKVVVAKNVMVNVEKP